MRTLDGVTKLCYKCGETKPVANFGKDRHKVDQLQAACRECKAAESRLWAQRNRGALAMSEKAPIIEKRCAKCRCIKAIDQFNRNRTTKDGHQEWCRACYSNRHLRNKYGLSEAQFTALMEQQQERCASCGRSFGQLAPHVDHNHATGAVRGLLCGPCNRGLGLFADDPDRLLGAAIYLLKGGESDHNIK